MASGTPAMAGTDLRATPTQAASEIPAWNAWDIVKAIAVVIVGTLVAGLLGAAIAETLLESGQEYEDNAAAYAIVLIPSMVIVELLLLGAAIWFGPRKYKLAMASLGLRTLDRASSVWPVALGAVGLGIVYGYDGLMSLLGVSPESTPDAVFENAGPFLVVVAGAILLAPVVEEIFFRGFVFGGLRVRRGWIVAALVSSLLFSLAHLSLYGLLPFAAIGFLFAWAYQRTGSIRPTIIAHAMINVVTVGAGLVASL